MHAGVVPVSQHEQWPDKLSPTELLVRSISWWQGYPSSSSGSLEEAELKFFFTKISFAVARKTGPYYFGNNWFFEPYRFRDAFTEVLIQQTINAVWICWTSSDLIHLLANWNNWFSAWTLSKRLRWYRRNSSRTACSTCWTRKTRYFL